MNYGGDAADQIVRYSLEGTEVALKLTGEAAKNFAVFAAAVLRDQKKMHGKTNLTRLLRENKPLRFFEVPESRMKEFAREANVRGLLYVPVRDRSKAAGKIEFAVWAEDAAKVNRVLEKMGDWDVDLSNYVQKETGKGLSTNDYTDAEKTKLGGIEEGANKYVHPTHTAAAAGFYKVTVDALGHVTAATKVTKTDITGLGIPAQDTTYDEATTAKAGLMSAADKTKLDGMNTTIDKAIANHTATDAEVSEMLAEIYGE